jgi:hypothetical protein
VRSSSASRALTLSIPFLFLPSFSGTPPLHTMPVMDAFKNLIRHGKNAKEVSPSAQPSSSSSSHHASSTSRSYPPASSTTTAHAPATSQQQHDRRKAAEVEQQKEEAARKEAAYQREAQEIVDEENKNKDKMPVYDGLEGFDLVEKMGE